MSYTTYRSLFARLGRLLVALALLLVLFPFIQSTPAQAALIWHIQTLDSAGLVGQENAIALDRSGRPVISYFDRTNFALKLVHCGDATCSSGNSFVIVDNDGDVGAGSSLALDSNDRPVISYYDSSAGHLKLAHCADVNCASGTSIVTVDSSGDVGRQSSLALDSSGRPVIAYIDGGNSNLKLAHCADANCASGTSIVTVDSSGAVGNEPALVLDRAGSPVISYLDTTNTPNISLKLAHCGDANCTNGNSITIAIEPDGSLIGNTLAINLAGNPIMAILDPTTGSLLLRTCDDPNCATIAAPHDLDSVGHAVGDVSLLLVAGSFPLISYYDGSSEDLKLLQCDNVTCSGNTSVVVDHVQSQMFSAPSISLASNGYPALSYWDGATDDLKLARLIEETTPTNTPTNTPTSTPTNTPTDVPTNTPTNTPTDMPTSTPTNTPTEVPTSTPTTTPVSAVDTSTSFTTSANPARLGEPITFRATIASASGETPDGTVTFLSDTAALGSGTLAQGVASFTTSSLPVGNSVITARYEGTTHFNTSISAPATQVVRAASTTTLTLSAPTSAFGEPITLTATVSCGTAIPSGSVTFYDGATALGTKALRSGTASLSISTLAAGQHTLTAVYGGSPGLDGSVSPAAIYTIAPAQTAAALIVAPSPSVLGQTVTLTATVSVVAPGGGKPAGTVSFYEGTTLLGTKTLGSNGLAIYNTSTLAVGSHSLRAEYGGSANHNASASAVAALVVTTADSITTLATSATDVVNGQKVTLTASVGAVAPGKGTPSGSISFRDGATELGSVALSNGRASKVVTLALGSHSLMAEYVPADGSFGASSGTASVTVSPASTSVTLTTSGTPSTYGAKVTFTAVVKVSAPGVGTPTGTVIFHDGNTVLAEVALINGKAIYATTALASGTHPITATYSGAAGNTGSVSSTLTQQVS